MNKKIICIISLAFLIRFLAIILLNSHINPETYEYDCIADTLIREKEYAFEHHNTIYRSFGYPVFPMLCATFHILTNHNYFILEIFQVILSIITCYFIYLITKKIYNEKTGLIASFLVATHPGLIVYSTKIHELTLVIFLTVAISWLIIALDWAKCYNNFLTGALIGIGTLTRPSLIFLLPAYFVYLILSSNKLKNILKPLLISSLSAILFIAPWTVRNYKIHKRLIFVTTYSGENFWQGNNQFASGSALAKDGLSILEKTPTEIKDRLYEMNELEQYDFFYREGIKFIKSNRGMFVKMLFKKFFYFWWFSPQAGILYPKTWTFMYKIYYAILFAFFVLGSWFSFKESSGINRKLILPSFVLFFLVSFLHSLYYVDVRHRWAIEPLMIIFSSIGIMVLFKNFLRTKLKAKPRAIYF